MYLREEIDSYENYRPKTEKLKEMSEETNEEFLRLVQGDHSIDTNYESRYPKTEGELYKIENELQRELKQQTSQREYTYKGKLILSMLEEQMWDRINIERSKLSVYLREKAELNKFENVGVEADKSTEQNNLPNEVMPNLEEFIASYQGSKTEEQLAQILRETNLRADDIREQSPRGREDGEERARLYRNTMINRYEDELALYQDRVDKIKKSMESKTIA